MRVTRLRSSARPRESGDPDGSTQMMMLPLDSRLRGNERETAPSRLERVPAIRSTRRLRTLLIAAALAPLVIASAHAGPNGATVVGGAATVQGQGTAAVVVNQTSQNAIINWQTFNIGPGETTKILMPGASSTELDRVTGGQGPSQIFGSLTSNGQVFLVNPDGILFGPNSKIDVAGLLATTSNISNSDFMAGRYNFSIPGNPAASVVNAGTITAQSGGFAALVAPGVRNTGTITAWLGQVGLASANTFALDLYGDRLIQLNVGDSIAAQVIDVSTGQPLSSLVSNEGTIKANGGRVELTAVAARTVVDSVINNTGVIEANSVGTQNGMIVLEAATAATAPAGAPLQLVTVSGTLSAAGKKKGTTGGTVVVTGQSVAVAGAKINASGKAGGGTVLIGGDTGGGNPSALAAAIPGAALESFAVPTATTVSVDAATLINASATGAGNGGKVVVWSNQATTFYGTILAQGGPAGGNGGFVETSGGTVDFAGITVNASAVHGAAGTWLLDPVDLIIDATLAGEIDTTLNGGTSVALQTSQSGNPSTPYTLTAGEMNASGNGDIIVDSPLSWTTATTLTLNAYNNIAINASITAASGGLTLNAENAILATAAVDIGTFNLQSGAWTQVASTLPAFSATDFTLSGGSFLRALGGDGSSGTPYQIADIYGLQGIGSSYALLASDYVLANNINATGTANWNGGAGFVPIGNLTTDLGVGFNGTFNGQGNTISNLVIKLPTNTSAGDYTGLFGYVGGAIANVGLIGGSVTGENDVGALVGYNYGTVSQSYATGTVSGQGGVGGLIGLNGGTVSQSYATGRVSGSYVGGLVGSNEGSVSQSYATGAVSGGSGSTDVGGLVGYSDGTVSQSYATGAASGSQYVGGLVGFDYGTVSQSYATGAVNGSSDLGGLVGWNAGNVSSSYWDTTTTGQTNGVAINFGTFSATGLTTPQLQAALPSGFDATAWGSNSGITINNGDPFLLWQLPSGTQVVAGYAYSDGGVTPIGGGVTVSGLLNGMSLSSLAIGDTVTLGANGSYNFLLQSGTISASGSQLLTYTNGANAGVAYQQNASGSIYNLNIYGGYLNETSGAGTLTAVSSGLATALGSNTSILNGLANRAINATAANFSIDQPISAENLLLVSSGTVTQTQSSPIAATHLGLLGSGGSYTLTNSGNQVGTLAADTGSVSLTDSTNLSIGIGGGINGVTATGALALNVLNNGTITAPGAVDVGSFTLAGGNWVQVNSSLPSFTAQDFTIAGGSFLRASGGGGTTGSPYQIADIYGLQGIGSSPTLLAANYVLANNIDATGTANWNGDAGFVPIGNGTTAFSGTFNGQGNTIANLTISPASTEFVGLFGVSSGAISNVGLVNETVDFAASGGASPIIAGGLAGVNMNSGTISGSYATGTLTGTGTVSTPGFFIAMGGLLGLNGGAIVQSYANSTVTSPSVNAGVEPDGFFAVGGLVGWNFSGTLAQYAQPINLPILAGLSFNGTVSQSYASSAVNGGIGANDIGGLVGLNDGSVLQSYATGAVYGPTGYVGGLVGRADPGDTITQSYATGAVSGGTNPYTGEGFDPNKVGGLVGVNDGTVTQSYATGAVTNGTDDLGGLVGLNDGIVTQSYATGAVSSSTSNNVGGLIGVNSGNVSSSYWDTYTTGQQYAYGNQTSIGATPVTSDPSQSSAANYAFNQSAYSNFNFTNDWFMIDGSTRPFGQWEYSTTITNAHQLQLMAINPAASYTLANNIDLGPDLANPSSMWGAAGFVPIGNTTTNFTGTFNGQGNTISNLTISSSDNAVGLFGYVATNGMITNVGLIDGTVSSSAEIPFVEGVGALVGFNNGTVSQSYATSAVSGTSSVGGLIGDNNGSVTQSYATGAVSGTSSVGGLIGGNNGSVTQSYATGTVSGSYHLGGLAGYNSGTVSQSYASGAVSGGTGSENVGGLVGFNIDGTVSQSYATGAVSGGSYVGGLVGLNEYSDGTVSQSYATGAVSGSSDVGGLVGANVNGASVSSSYWDITTSGIGSTNGVGNVASASGVTGLKTADFGNTSSFVGWNFGTTLGGAGWVIVDADGSLNNAGGAGATRPFLLSEYSTNIANAHQLQLMALDLTANYKLASNIDLGPALAADHNGNYPGMWGAAGFVPIGNSTTNFSGTLNGQGNTISNLKMAPTDPYVSDIGLFDDVGDGGQVSNLALNNVSITADPNLVWCCQSIGALAGQNEGLISNVTASGQINGSIIANVTAGIIGNVTAGGLVGSNGSFGPAPNGTITNVPGTITESQAAVNITLGDGGTCNINSCSGSPNTAGGMVGVNLGTIASSSASGSVVVGANAWAGGLVGTNENPTYYSNGISFVAAAGGSIASSYASGAVSSAGANVQLGGLVGQNDPLSLITNSQAYGAVTSTATLPPNNDNNNCSTNCEYVNVGGFVGQNYGTISGAAWTTAPALPVTCAASYTCASGNVAVGALGQGGGFVGQNDGIISYAFATGNVTGAAGLPNTAGEGPFSNTTSISGFANDNTGMISNAFATGNVGTAGTAYLSAAGFANSNEGTIANSFATGAVTTGDSSMAGGFVGSNSPNTTPGENCYFFCGDGNNNNAAITNSQAYGNVTVEALSIAGGFATVGGGGGNPGGTFVNITASGPVNAGEESIVGGLVGVILTGASIQNSAAQNTLVASSGPNSIVGGIAGFSEGGIANTTSSAPVSGTSNSYIGGAVGINFGSLTGVTVGPAVGGGNLAVAGSGSGNFIGGVAGLNAGSISGSIATIALSSGVSSYVGGVAGVNGTYTNESSITFANSSFPTGTIDTATTATGTGFSSLIGTSTPTSAPAAPSWLNNANCNDPACGILISGTLQGPTVSTVVTYSVANASSTYGTVATPGAVTLTSVPGGSTVTGVTPTVEVFSGSTQISLAANTPAGTYTEEVTALSSTNYTIASSGNTNGTLIIKPALLTVTGGKIYDATTGFAVGQLDVTGGVPGETVTLTSGTGTSSSANAATYNGSPLSGLAISVSGGNALASNYQLPTTGTLTINPEAVTITASTNTKTYDSTTSAAAPPIVTTGALYSVDGAVLSETYTTANAGTDLTLTPSVSFGSPAGSGNYSVTYANNTMGVINAEAVTITASTNAKTYDSTTSAVALPTVTTGTLYSVDGAVLSETYTTANAGTGLTLTPSVSFGSPGGSGNYSVTYANNTTGVINPAALTYVATAESITYGAAIPVLTGSVGGLVNTDTQASATIGTLDFSTAATSSSNAGSYAITGSGLTVNDTNYASTIAQAPGNATALTIAAPTTPATPASDTTVTQQTTQFVQTATYTETTTPPPVVTVVDLTTSTGTGTGDTGTTGSTGNSNGGSGGTTGSGTGGTGTGGTGTGTGGTGTGGGGTGTGGQANGKHGGNGEHTGTRLVDMKIIPLPSGSGMPPPGETRFASNEVVLQFAPGMTPQQIADIGRRFGLILNAQESIGVLGRAVYTFRIGNGETVRDVIAAIEAAGVTGAAAQPNYKFGLSQDDNVRVASLGDPAQYIVEKFHLGAVHRITEGDHVVVALIDSEIDADQPDLAGAVTDRFDAGCGDAAPDPHGTGMAGAIASHINLLGIAPHAKLMAICAFGGKGTLESSSTKIATGLDYAIKHGAKIINMSFAGPRDPTVAQELQIAREKGIVLIAAAGNDGPNSPPLYPGADPNVIAVTATDEKDRLFLGANQGDYIAVAAPGVDILVPAPHSGVQFTTGTSVATAHVSGVVALLLAQKPTLTPEEIRAILTSTAKHPGAKGTDRKFGAGLIDPLKALRLKPLS